MMPEETEDANKTKTPETANKPKTGVFVCHCGRNIAGNVTIDDLLNELRTSDPELVVKDHIFLCSEDGQKLIKDAIQEEGLDRVVARRKVDEGIKTRAVAQHTPARRSGDRDIGSVYPFAGVVIRHGAHHVTGGGRAFPRHVRDVVRRRRNLGDQRRLETRP